jgi:hypothetical protein
MPNMNTERINVCLMDLGNGDAYRNFPDLIDDDSGTAAAKRSTILRHLAQNLDSFPYSSERTIRSDSPLYDEIYPEDFLKRLNEQGFSVLLIEPIQ